jgi:uncharacterized membrane protein YcaP (DUF421 family)
MAKSQAPGQGRFAGERFQRFDLRARRVGLLLLLLLTAGTFTGLYSQPATILRAASVYLFLMFVFRFAGHRTLAQITNFDLILVLIIGDATQNAIVGDDTTVLTAAVAIGTLVLLDVAMGRGKQAWPALDDVVDGMPVVLVAHGEEFQERMKREGVDSEDILATARERQGITRMEEIEYAVLERSGGISIIPANSARRAR